ncbi:MAG TPA: hemerythrin domain-containing protein [Candidatus Thermoplasmatota archaeon]|nr:hemerythrin domain-containing protein [Candidatus Thermoplasmatota archaeon]
MKPIGILMREHRFIELMIASLEKEKETIEASGKIRSDFLATAVDFFRVYGDKNHHGKEEDILFRRLSEKPLSIEHRRIMSLLIDEHNIARSYIRMLDGGRERSLLNTSTAAREIIETIEKIRLLYTKHIETEEKRFFYPAMDYFSEEEQEQMIQDFYAYEQTIDREKYESMVKHIENNQPVIMKKIFGR